MNESFLPTPIYKLDAYEKENVYEPAEDTFLLLDALEKDKQFIYNLLPNIILEIGTGSGVITAFIMKNFNLENTFFIASDINYIACKVAQKTIYLNTNKTDNSLCDILVDNLAQSLLPRLQNQIDVVIFNPPYIVTEKDEMGTYISKAWKGGENGRKIIDESIRVINLMLSPKGVAYIVLIKENHPKSFIKSLRNDLKLESEIILQRRAYNELLYIIKCCRINNENKL